MPLPSRREREPVTDSLDELLAQVHPRTCPSCQTGGLVFVLERARHGGPCIRLYRCDNCGSSSMYAWSLDRKAVNAADDSKGDGSTGETTGGRSR
jgi:hypothetical protein